MRWTVLVPLKALPEAKSRLAGAAGDRAAHLRLVEAIRRDTLAAARAAGGVARVVTVLDRPSADEATRAELSYVQREPGLNAGLAEAAAWAARCWPDDGVAVLLGDLPALSSAALADTLTAADGLAAGGGPGRGYVADRAGTGTTLLTAGPGQDLIPAFGAGSASRHAESGAIALAAAPQLRTDVDTADDLQAAADLGLGPATAAVLATLANRRSSTVHLDTA